LKGTNEISGDLSASVPTVNLGTQTTPFQNIWVNAINDVSGGAYFSNGGNSFGSAASLGTNDGNTLTVKTDNIAAMTIDGSSQAITIPKGSLTLGTTSVSSGILNLGTQSGGGVSLQQNATATSHYYVTLPTTKPSSSSVMNIDSSFAGNVSFIADSAGNGYVRNGGNASISGLTVGTTTNQPIELITGNALWLALDVCGNLTFFGPSLSATSALCTLKNVTISGTIGPQSGTDATSVGIGSGALANINPTGGGIGNIAIGENAMNTMTTGQYNCAIGPNAMQSATNSVDFNFGLGCNALKSVSGLSNIGIGVNAGPSANSYNVFIGGNAGYGATTNGNVCVGNDAGMSVNLNHNTVCIGANAGQGGAGYSSICLGYNASNTSPLPSYSIVLNATGSGLNPTVQGCYISSIAGVSSTGLTPASSTSTGALAGYGMVVYNPTTCCLQYVYS
jgi:hypothetical protein